MTVAVVAEKPSVARDLARVLGADRRGEGYLHGNGYVVTWAIGHLVALAEPHQIDPAWRTWRRADLPILPERWPLVVLEPTRAQFEVVRRILSSPKVASVVCATDAGREGELIFRLIYEAAGSDKKFTRLWISSLTSEAIRAGFARLEDGHRYDRLALAARARSRADWLVGMNLSRAYSLGLGEVFSIGRVQTPTLAMLVERELAIRAFVPEDYLEVTATFSPREGATYVGGYEASPEPDERGRRERTRLPADGDAAARVVERAQSGEAAIESVAAEERRMPPPFLYDLTELQRHAHRLFGLSAKRTLDIAQALYERHKLLSYPRTDSRHLSHDVAATLPAIVRAIEGPYRQLLAPGTGQRPLGPRFVDDTKVTDHHAILPTATSGAAARLSADEQRIYDLVCRRLLAAWHGPHVTAVTTVITAIATAGAGPLRDRYRTVGTAVKELGWKALDITARRRPGDEPTLPSGLAAGQAPEVVDARAVPKKTEPPARYTEGTLLTAMETAGRTLEDRELSEAMREVGLGTPATRAAIIETLLSRAYIVRKGKALEATDKGIELIRVVHPAVKSPAMTGAWEAKLRRIERGAGDFDVFMREIEEYVRQAVGSAPESPPPAPAPAPAPATSPRAVSRSSDLGELLASAFGFASFRPYQEAVCRAATAGEDVLLVMPTGAGKSLCYQLPGLARGGTTLVVSPLIALIEDQVHKLCERGLRAERVHSGRDRAASRAACRAYADGALDYLFIAPERLAVAGFLEALAARKPALVAVDEAHCISHWGHDFRTEYRMLGQRLVPLRPAPIVALTATATPRVQDDIVAQLGIPAARRFVHGFRRENLAIEAVSMPPDERPGAVRSLLSGTGRRPAIVYVPTRKQAESIAGMLARPMRAAAYHAGMRTADRDRVQAAFLAGRLEVIVATIAFGMGIDKPDVRTVVHTALPASVEGYYQEIGRAGRDGAPSRAVLLHSYADLRTQEYFLDKSYPEPSVLEGLYRALGSKPTTRQALLDSSREDEEVVERALEQLWIHGGALVDPDERVRRGDARWGPSYAAQRAHRKEQLARMAKFPEARDCRMRELVRHFGDQEDSGAPCGLCDFCSPAACEVRRFETGTTVERRAMRRILAALAVAGNEPTGRLHRELFEGVLERPAFERVLSALASAGLIEIRADAFEKDGRRIEFSRASLTAAGRTADERRLAGVTLDAARARRRPERGGRKRSAAKPKRTKARGRPSSGVEAALTAFRLAEARRSKLPAFRIFSDRVLVAIAAAWPADEEALRLVPGVSASMAKRYGRQILAVLARSRSGRRDSKIARRPRVWPAVDARRGRAIAGSSATGAKPWRLMDMMPDRANQDACTDAAVELNRRLAAAHRRTITVLTATSFLAAGAALGFGMLSVPADKLGFRALIPAVFLTTAATFTVGYALTAALLRVIATRWTRDVARRFHVSAAEVAALALPEGGDPSSASPYRKAVLAAAALGCIVLVTALAPRTYVLSVVLFALIGSGSATALNRYLGWRPIR